MDGFSSLIVTADCHLYLSSCSCLRYHIVSEIRLGQKDDPMHIVHVFIHVKADKLDEFKKASEANAANSIQEPGIARFDFLQQGDDPTRFLLVEVYRTPEDAAKHKETAHYNLWREAVEPMLVEPRSRIVYRNIYPADSGWG